MSDWISAEKELPELNKPVEVIVVTETRGVRNTETTFQVDENPNAKSNVIHWKYIESKNEDNKL